MNYGHGGHGRLKQEMEMMVRVWESWEKMEDEEDEHRVVKWLMKLEDFYECLDELMRCLGMFMGCQIQPRWDFYGYVSVWGQNVDEGKWKEGYFWKWRWKVYECGPKSCLHAFLNIPPFSPSHCVPKIALNEASKFEFEVGANFASFGKMLQKCIFLLFAKRSNLCFMSFSLPTSLFLAT